MSLQVRKANIMRANNKSSKNGDQSTLHPKHYSIHGVLNLVFYLLVNLTGFDQSFIENGTMFQTSFLNFENKIYRS
jgi:hypothetical protein